MCCGRVLAAGCKPLTMGGGHPIVLPIPRAGRQAWPAGAGARPRRHQRRDVDWTRAQSFTVVPAHAVWYAPLAPLMAQVREPIGPTRPVHISVAIDGLGLTFGGGTGSPEIGALTVPQGLEIIPGCRRLNGAGGDLAGVSPPCDPSGNTALLEAKLRYEMPCVLPCARPGVRPGEPQR